MYVDGYGKQPRHACKLPNAREEVLNTVWVCLDGHPTCMKAYQVVEAMVVDRYRKVWRRLRPWHVAWWDAH